MKQWLREFGQKVKALFGLQSDCSYHLGMYILAKADGTFETGQNMLMEGAVTYGIVEAGAGKISVDNPAKAKALDAAVTRAA